MSIEITREIVRGIWGTHLSSRSRDKSNFLSTEVSRFSHVDLSIKAERKYPPQNMILTRLNWAEILNLNVYHVLEDPVTTVSPGSN